MRLKITDITPSEGSVLFDPLSLRPAWALGETPRNIVRRVFDRETRLEGPASVGKEEKSIPNIKEYIYISRNFKAKEKRKKKNT